MTRIITIASGKGGVGKTFVATNLAMALSRFGRDVTIIDGNFTTPNVSLHLGMQGVPITLHDVLTQRASINESIYVHPSGVKVIPGGLPPKDIREFQKNIGREIVNLIGTTEFLIIDAAAGLGEEFKDVLEASDEVLFVTNPELPAVTDCLKAIEISRRLGRNPTGVIVNRALGKNYELSKENIEKFLGVPVIGTIFEDEPVKKSIALKVPVVISYPESKSAIEIKKVAARLIGQEYLVKNDGYSWIERIKKIFGF